MALSTFAKERNWPQPTLGVEAQESPDSVWRYRIVTPQQTLGEHEFQPGKLLAIGGVRELSSLLGLETIDPFMGLPAKWISAGQRERALALPLEAVFDEPAVIATHLLQTLPPSWTEVFGLREILDWLSAVSPAHHDLLESHFLPHQGLFTETVAELIREVLWLPSSEEFLELFGRKLPLADPTEPGQLLELLRAEIVPRNLQHLVDPSGTLRAIDWRGTAEEDSFPLLFVRLDHALGRSEHPAVVITSVETRQSLSRALRHSFPETPVLSWDELPQEVSVNVESVIDAQMEFDPSPWPQAVYFSEFGNKPNNFGV